MSRISKGLCNNFIKFYSMSHTKLNSFSGSINWTYFQFLHRCQILDHHQQESGIAQCYRLFSSSPETCTFSKRYLLLLSQYLHLLLRILPLPSWLSFELSLTEYQCLPLRFRDFLDVPISIFQMVYDFRQSFPFDQLIDILNFLIRTRQISCQTVIVHFPCCFSIQ